MSDPLPVPSKEELLSHLTRLNEVTLEVNDLMGQLGGAKTQDEVEVLRRSIAQKTNLQSEIIEQFLLLSLDRERVQQFKEIVQEITRDAQRLETVSTDREISAMQETISAKVNRWSTLLEEIIAGVMGRAR